MNYYNISKDSIGLDFSYFVNVRSSFDEKGYNALVWIISNLFNDPQAYMLFQAFFVCGTFLVFIYDNCDDFFLGLITYVCLNVFTFYYTAYRQGIACSIILWAIYLKKRKKFFIPLLLILLASQFHRTSIVLLPLIFYDKLKLNFKSFFIFSLCVLVISLFIDKIIDIANEEFDSKYGGHTEYNTFIGPLINFIIFGLSYLLTYLSYISSNKCLYEKDSMLGFFIFMGLTGTFMYLGRYFETQALERVAFYFTPAFIVLLPNAICRCKGVFKEDVIVKYAFIFLSIFLFYIRFSSALKMFNIWFL